MRLRSCTRFAWCRRGICWRFGGCRIISSRGCSCARSSRCSSRFRCCSLGRVFGTCSSGFSPCTCLFHLPSFWRRLRIGILTFDFANSFWVVVLPAIIMTQIEPLFLHNRRIFIRESSSRIYSPYVFAIGQVIGEIPYSILCGFLYWVLMVRLAHHHLCPLSQF